MCIYIYMNLWQFLELKHLNEMLLIDHFLPLTWVVFLGYHHHVYPVYLGKCNFLFPIICFLFNGLIFFQLSFPFLLFIFFYFEQVGMIKKIKQLGLMIWLHWSTGGHLPLPTFLYVLGLIKSAIKTYFSIYIKIG